MRKSFILFIFSVFTILAFTGCSSTKKESAEATTTQEIATEQKTTEESKTTEATATTSDDSYDFLLTKKELIL